jgi:hypothetical protein
MSPNRKAPAWGLVLAAIILGSSWQVATALNLTSAAGAIREAYTTNAICGKKNCINPIFPGLEDLHLLQQSKWIASSLQKTAPSMGFCRNAITYDPALPVPNGPSSVKALVQRQDNAASTMFYYHLTGLGLEAWDYQKPELANDCVKSVWRMVCFTYFPRAAIGVQDGAYSDYIRPCQSSCTNYIRACQVECCDESVQCVFSHTKVLSATQTVTTEGYAPHDGPSSLCTGDARRSTLFWVAMILVMALSLQGCDLDIPVHQVGNWRGQQDYLVKSTFIPPGSSAKQAYLNSCSVTHLSQTLQCSGRGVCKMWDPSNIENTLSFCECDRDWADPECRTKRKSQAVAYLLSVFGGLFGLDQLYLGHTGAGIVKLFSLGGFGLLWIRDIIFIGSAPPYAAPHFRTAQDLPHYQFVLITTMVAVFNGFLIAYVVTINFRQQKRKEAFLMQMNEEVRQREAIKLADTYQQSVLQTQRGPGPYGTMGAMLQSMGAVMPPSMAGMNPFGP